MSEIILSLIGGLLSEFALGLMDGGVSIITILLFSRGRYSFSYYYFAYICRCDFFYCFFSYIKKFLVKFKIAFLMATSGIISIYLGSLANKVLKGPEILISFTILMIFIGFKMTKPKNQNINKKTTEIDYKKILIFGCVTGFANVFLCV